MELLIRAHNTRDANAVQPLVVRVDERGGTIGRSETNTLTLPDPQRHISRLQAEIGFGGGRFHLRNVGSANALLVSGRPLNPGEVATLNHGDELVIGSYVLRIAVRDSGEAAHADTSAAVDARVVIKASVTESKTDPRIAQAVPSAPPPARAPAPSDSPFADLFATPKGPGADPFADLLAPAPPQRPTLAPRAVAGPAPAILPDDFDPFAEPAPPPAPVQEASKTADEGGLGGLLDPGAAAPTLDDAFGLGPADTRGADPLAAFLAAPIDAGAAPSASLDPLQLFGSATADDAGPSRPSAFDHVPELQAAYAPPAVLAPAPSPAPASPALGPAPPQPPAKPSAGVVADPSSLWAAFFAGAGVAAHDAPAPDVATMREAGRILYEAVDGALKLIAARAAFKQEMRAEVTLIRPQQNNPLKFSPDAPAAIDQLLRPPLRGFMAGAPAMHEAMSDLLGHAVGTMAGMRAALQGVLQRFEPAQLESKLGAQSVLDSLLPMNRRARLWELYRQHYESIRDEAQEDFHELFGKAFVQAYEEQAAKLKGPDGR